MEGNENSPSLEYLINDSSEFGQLVILEKELSLLGDSRPINLSHDKNKKYVPLFNLSKEQRNYIRYALNSIILMDNGELSIEYYKKNKEFFYLLKKIEKENLNKAIKHQV